MLTIHLIHFTEVFILFNFTISRKLPGENLELSFLRQHFELAARRGSAATTTAARFFIRSKLRHTASQSCRPATCTLLSGAIVFFDGGDPPCRETQMAGGVLFPARKGG